MLRLFVSNRQEQLYHELKQQLFAQAESSFARRLVSVPHANMRRWLQYQFATDPEIGIAAGFELLNEEQAIASVVSFFMPKAGALKHRPSRLELSLALEREIALNPLNRLFNSNQPSKTARRILTYADTLADLFDRYGRYGGAFLHDWPVHDLGSWEHNLWQRLFGPDGPWTHRYAALDMLNLDQTNAPRGLQVHFFCHDFLSLLHLTFLKHLSRSCAVNLYLLSPSSLYWNDLLSGREQRRLERYWERRGASTQQRQKLSELIQDTNPLLAQWGRVGRETSTLLERFDPLTHDTYFLPTTVLQDPTYTELAPDYLQPEPATNPLTLLQAVQADLLLLRNPHSTGPIALRADDRSIQVHALPSKGREVEALYDHCLSLITQHAQDPTPLLPSDILVLASNLACYLPFIKATFSSRESLLKPQIVDLSLKDQSPFVQVYLHLLNLVQGRWEAPALLQLLSSPFFRARHQLTEEDIGQISTWIQQAPIYWGEDQTHRDAVLKTVHEQGMVDKEGIGTWEYGLRQLLLCLANGSDGYKIPFSDTPLLDKFIRLIESLRSDLRPLRQGTQMSLKEWADYLQCLSDAYLAPVEDNSLSSQDRDLLHSHFQDFSRAFHQFPNEIFRFESINRRLDQALAEHIIARESPDLQTVRFCAFKPNRVIPARVIILLGMEEGSATHPDSASPLDLLKGHPKGDYYPSNTDRMRYLFLECLLSARDALIFSYLNVSCQDGKEQQPCLPLEELTSYLDRHYRLGEKPGGKALTRHHPFFAFDPSYFQPQSPFKSYSKTFFRAARIYCGIDPAQQSFRELGHPWTVRRKKSETRLTISLRDLEMTVRDPMRLHLNQTLGIYLPHESQREIKAEEPFALSPVLKSSLRSACLKQPFEEVMSRARQQGQLPFGALGLVAKEQLRQDLTPVQALLTRQKGFQSIRRLQLHAHCAQPYEVQSGVWHIPSFKIAHPTAGEVEIIGSLDRITPEGILVEGDGTFADAVKAWPSLLLLQSVSLPFTAAPCLFFLGEGKTKSSFVQDPLQHLLPLIDHYVRCLSEASPLAAEWAHLYAMESADTIAARIERDLAEAEGGYRHRYLRWALGTPDRSQLLPWVMQWKETGQKLYQPLAQHWYARGTL